MDSTLVIFAYAPAGLGHLRVTDALRHGLSPTTRATLFPAGEAALPSIHHFFSVYPATHRLMEWFQSGWREDLLTYLYRTFITRDSRSIVAQVERLAKEQLTSPTHLVIVATHFGAAHQIAAAKASIAARTHARVFLAVQVTDDSPQHIWYVPGADLLAVPSISTRQALLAYGKTLVSSLPPLKAQDIVVLPYPLSPSLSLPLTPSQYHQRLRQYDPDDLLPIQVAIPISGAAVGIRYALDLMDTLSHLSPRFLFHIIVKRSVYTHALLNSLHSKANVVTHVSHSDRQIIEIYESLYAHSVIAFELTKPSEQAFKAMLSPRSRGGSLLLFAPPVGRQEYDNLAFLRRHTLLSSTSTSRGFLLPPDGREAARQIFATFRAGTFHAMGRAHLAAPTSEVSPDGVQLFWKTIAARTSLAI